MNTRTEFVNFQCDVEQALPHPEMMCVCLFVGKAKIEIEIEGDGDERREYRAAEIVELWMTIDPPTDPPPHVFQLVSIPDYNSFFGIGEWQKLLPELESAAFDNYDYCLHAVTLPSEINPVNTGQLKTSKIFN